MKYEALDPLHPGAVAIVVPYWQLPDSSCLTRTRPQGHMQNHPTDMEVPAKLHTSHSLRKGGVTAMLAAKVSLPQIQLMARWISPNMAQPYAALAADVSGEILTAIGRVETLNRQHHEKQFWAAYTTNASSGFAGHSR